MQEKSQVHLTVSGEQHVQASPLPPDAAAVQERALLYRASDSLMNGLVWLDTHAPDWVRADIKQTRATLATALERRQ